MKILKGRPDSIVEGRSAVAIGKFDGLHIGHKRLLEQVIKQKQRGLLAVVFTFDPSPSVLFSGQLREELTDKEEKRELFKEMGIDVLIEFPLTRATADIPAKEFLQDILVNKLKLSYLCAGEDLSFGKNGEGNSSLLCQYADEWDYQVELIDKVILDNEVVSSSRIRKEMADGNIELVNRLLGRNYSILGKVAHGKALGREMGVPTLNIPPAEGKLFPRKGVYFSQVLIKKDCYKGITNIGHNPSVQSDNGLHIETFLYGFEGDLYDSRIQIQLLKYDRPEMKFESVLMLKQQLEKDIADGLNFHHLSKA